MQRYQIRLACGLCDRKIVIDVVSWGSPHQSVQAATCLECAEKAGVPLLPEGKMQDLKAVPTDPLSAEEISQAFGAFRRATKEQFGTKG